MNGHFASVGDEPSKAHYEHGIQVIDGDKEYKYVDPPPARIKHLTELPGILVS